MEWPLAGVLPASVTEGKINTVNYDLTFNTPVAARRDTPITSAYISLATAHSKCPVLAPWEENWCPVSILLRKHRRLRKQGNE